MNVDKHNRPKSPVPEEVLRFNEAGKKHYLDTVTCGKCRTEQPTEFAFCPICGESLTGRPEKPQPDRLLTPEEIDNNWPIETPQYDTIEETLMEGILIGAKAIAKAQRDLTASIKDAECQGLKEELRIGNILTAKLTDKCRELEAECQQRVERAFREIEEYHTTTFHGHNNIFITDDEWQSLKDKELKQEGKG